MLVGPIAQSVEQRTFNPWVDGSSPSGPTPNSISQSASFISEKEKCQGRSISRGLTPTHLVQSHISNTCYTKVMDSKSLPTEFASPREFFEKITDRKEIQLLNNAQIREFFYGKRILITGAGGTIGSAVSRRLVSADIPEVYFLDRDESALHALALSLSDTAASHSEKCLVADVRDLVGLTEVFKEIMPDIVIHTAALKHLIVLERFPREGFLTNVVGTLNVLNAASVSGIRQILNVSTDKAALPTSVLGKTKLIAEHIMEELSSSQMLTSSVRFGNVFASRGSVIETFIHQIENDLPVTITDPEVTRFFMSHNEAANLILATCMMQTNAVFVQEMGTRIRIVDVVNRLAQALGRSPKVSFLGLQPGEKLHEDLYERDFVTTSNPAIIQLSLQKGTDIAKYISLSETPKNNKEALELIEILLRKIHEKTQ
jgi:FlaA1/EpsC-like NDP-sugar epimerase